jgi:tetratricopeptide (TPR) repeat protein
MTETGSQTRDQRLEELLASLERKAAGNPPGHAAPIYHHAGDACRKAGDLPRALGYWGRAIDAYLEANHFNAAAAVCRKLLQGAPHAVRTHCTLAWLALGRGLASEFRPALVGYVNAARGAGQSAVAVRQIVRMADAAADARLRGIIEGALRELGAEEAAAAVNAANATRDPSPPGAADRESRWAAVMRGAMDGGLH